MKKIAVIPVKEKSERVESKNFREFFKGKSLFDLLIEKLIHSNTFDKIYVSSNSHTLKEKINSLGIEFISRDDSFCNNDIPWSDVIAHVAESIPEKDDSILAWCHTTSPLFTDYDKAMKKFAFLQHLCSPHVQKYFQDSIHECLLWAVVGQKAPKVF